MFPVKQYTKILLLCTQQATSAFNDDSGAAIVVKVLSVPQAFGVLDA